MKRIYSILLTSALALAGCAEVDLRHPYGDDNGQAPGPVRDVQVENFSGGAVLRYTLPGDLDLSYVKATFTGTNGIQREATASAYVDSLVIDGFGDTREYSVEIRSYDKFEHASTPVTVKVNPLTPPIQTVFESLEYSIDFGGFIITYENVSKAEVGIYVTRRNSATGEMEYYDVYFTKLPSGQYAVRGLPDDENDFGIYVSDRWGNTSEVLSFTGTPLREDLLDKEKFEWVDPSNMKGDLSRSDYDASNYPQKFWNGVIDNWDYIHTVWPLPFPHRFTVDLGVSAQLSRVKTWQRSADDVRWQHGADVLAGWTLLGDFVSVKPSGLPTGQVSDEDVELVAEGEEFIFPRDIPAVRYIRFEVNAVHSAMLLSCMSEMTLWGQIEEDFSDN